MPTSPNRFTPGYTVDVLFCFTRVTRGTAYLPLNRLKKVQSGRHLLCLDAPGPDLAERGCSQDFLLIQSHREVAGALDIEG